jgi:ABC-2 type transport system ATP-binding protein
MLRICGISKTFRGRAALHPLSLEVSRGEIFGLLGHNGAGKSTTFGILLGQIRPDAGEAWIGDVSVQRHRSTALRQVGAIFETPAFYDYLTGLQNLQLLTTYSAFVSEARMREVIELVGLSGRIRDRVRVYSHGMRQRLALAQALLPAPELILLDEPSEGLDPEGIEEMRRLILRLRAERGLTVVISSHLLSEVEQMCDRIAILNEGRLMYCGAWNESAAAQRRVRFEVDDWASANGILEKAGATMEGGGVAVLPEGAEIAELVAAMVRAGIRVSGVEPVRVSLEDFYLRRIRG